MYGEIRYSEYSDLVRVQIIERDEDTGREYEPAPLELSSAVLQAAAAAAKRTTWGQPEIEAATGAVARFWPSTPADPPPAPDPGAP